MRHFILGCVEHNACLSVHFLKNHFCLTLPNPIFSHFHLVFSFFLFDLSGSFTPWNETALRNHDKHSLVTALFCSLLVTELFRKWADDTPSDTTA